MRYAENEKRMKQLLRAGVTTAAAAAVLGLAGCSSSVQMPDTIKIQSAEGSHVITVTGREEVKVVPDMAQIEYGIYTQADTAAACQEQNGKDLEQAIETLKGLGVAENSIQTSSYGMNPIYNWDSGRQEITGYEMNTQITVSDIPVGDLGGILSQSVAAGVNQISSVSYFSSSYDESYQEALKGAMAVAEAKAQALAEAGGMSVAGVSSIQEFGYNPYTRYSGDNSLTAGKRMALESAAAADMAVMPGEVSVEAQVTVDFEIQ